MLFTQQVNHFSKYGLGDSSDENEEADPKAVAAAKAAKLAAVVVDPSKKKAAVTDETPKRNVDKLPQQQTEGEGANDSEAAEEVLKMRCAKKSLWSNTNDADESPATTGIMFMSQDEVTPSECGDTMSLKKNDYNSSSMMASPAERHHHYTEMSFKSPSFNNLDQTNLQV